MKNNLLRLAGAAFVALAVSSFVKADPIEGLADVSNHNSFAIYDSGSITFLVSTAPNVYTAAPTGSALITTTTQSFTAFQDDLATFNPFPATLGTGYNVLTWVDNEASAFFVLHTVDQLGTTPNSLGFYVWGTGTVYVDGIGRNAKFSFTFVSSTPGHFAYTSETEVIPDGGTTALLVGMGLVGMGFIARRRK